MDNNLKVLELPVNIDLHKLTGESSQVLACICCLAQGMVVLPLLLPVIIYSGDYNGRSSDI